MSNPSEFSCLTVCVIAKLWCLIAVICLYSVQLQWRKRQRGEFSSRLALLVFLVVYSHQSLCRHLAWTCVTGSPCQLPGSWWICYIPRMVLRRSCEMLTVFMWVGMSNHWDTGINEQKQEVQTITAWLVQTGRIQNRGMWTIVAGIPGISVSNFLIWVDCNA